MVVGILFGTFFANHFSSNRLNIINSGSSRLNNLLNIVSDQYVDAVNMDSLMERAIPQILADLDPHSVYISAKDVQAVHTKAYATGFTAARILKHARFIQQKKSTVLI